MNKGDIFEVVEHHVLSGRLIFKRAVTAVSSDIYEFDVEGVSFKTATFKKERFEEFIKSGQFKKIED